MTDDVVDDVVDAAISVLAAWANAAPDETEHRRRCALIVNQMRDAFDLDRPVPLAAAYAPPPPGWHTFGAHANYEEDFGEPCPLLVFSEETDEAGMPLWERVDVAALHREWEPGRWWRVVNRADPPNIWCETSDEDEARRALVPGHVLQRLWHTVTEYDWRNV